MVIQSSAMDIFAEPREPRSCNVFQEQGFLIHFEEQFLTVDNYGMIE